MRLVIDLQFCQHANPASTDDTLSLAQHLAKLDGRHDVWIAFSNQHPARIAALRAAFDGLIPPEQVLVYETPAPDGSERVQRSIELIRNNFFAALGADLVFTPHLLDGAAGAIGGIGAHLPFLTAVSIGTEGDLTPVAGAVLQASLLLAGSPVVAEHLRAQPGVDAARVIEIGEDTGESAQRAWHAFERACAERPARTAQGRPALAYVSPLPPQQSGIADYSAELIEQLERFYEIHLIVPEIIDFDPVVADRFPIHTVQWFEENSHWFERILYHFGNSNVHQFMFGLLERKPGIIVLHDFFLSNVLYNLDYMVPGSDLFRRALFHSHGYSGLAHRQTHGAVESVWKYPANKFVLDQATGVIVHSSFSTELAEEWYGPASARNWRILPLLRGKPAGRMPKRETIRRSFDIADDELLICSFGMMGPTKLNDVLLDAYLDLPPALRRRCRLVYVGGGDPGPYGKELEQRLVDHGLGDAVTITGFVDADTYRDYLQIADVAVQLRGQTRGETSASVLDCLLYGTATIVNDNGANAALPDSVLFKLPAEFTTEQLKQALVTLCEDPVERLGLAARGQTLVETEHAPARVGKLYAEAIEDFTCKDPAVQYRALLRDLGQLGLPGDPRHHELIAAAKAIGANQPTPSSRQLFIDISAVVQFDLKTGIQRVVRSILLSLIARPPAGFRIEPVYSYGGNHPYHYARRFMLEMMGEAGIGADDEAIVYKPGDVFLGLDLVMSITPSNQRILEEMRNQGVRVYFVMYDLLPLVIPHVFPYGTETEFRKFTTVLAQSADGVVCISRAVADEFDAWVKVHGAARQTPLRIGYFHLGADISASAPSTGLPSNAEQVFAAIDARPTILMVGTVEPRKGHTQTVEAFDLLWKQNVPVNLVIVGKAGWMMESLIKHVTDHPEADRHLFWLPGASDEMLSQLYEKSSALLAASIGEGFGLPLIEAAQHHLPVIARNLPVFREVSGEHAFYFDGEAPEDLANALKAWLALHGEDKAPQSSAMPWLSWAESTDQLLESVVHGRWYLTLPPK